MVDGNADAPAARLTASGGCAVVIKVAAEWFAP